MVSLNYKHLRYFWRVAKAGSIARAAQQLQRTLQYADRIFTPGDELLDDLRNRPAQPAIIALNKAAQEDIFGQGDVTPPARTRGSACRSRRPG